MLRPFCLREGSKWLSKGQRLLESNSLKQAKGSCSWCSSALEPMLWGCEISGFIVDHHRRRRARRRSLCPTTE